MPPLPPPLTQLNRRYRAPPPSVSSATDANPLRFDASFPNIVFPSCPPYHLLHHPSRRAAAAPLPPPPHHHLLLPPLDPALPNPNSHVPPPSVTNPTAVQPRTCSGATAPPRLRHHRRSFGAPTPSSSRSGNHWNPHPRILTSAPETQIHKPL
jgi:hypothetical protein